MKTRILTIAMVLMIGMMFSNSANAGRRTSGIASSLENAIDPAKSIESWMVFDLNWKPSEITEIFSVKEESLDIEEWMIEPAMWVRFKDATESSLGIETWMTNELFWGKNYPATDLNIQIAEWMVNPENWTRVQQSPSICESVLKVEPWMVNENIWKS